MNNQVILDLQLECINSHGLPDQKKIKSWVQDIFILHNTTTELTIRIVDVQEMLDLNWYYLGKNCPTNVLSFPCNHSSGIKSSLIGDIVICKQIVEYEAQKYNVSSDAHWAHMIIHGSLHLLGYDHICNTDFILMNQMELKMIQKFGFQTCCI